MCAKIIWNEYLLDEIESVRIVLFVVDVRSWKHKLWGIEKFLRARFLHRFRSNRTEIFVLDHLFLPAADWTWTVSISSFLKKIEAAGAVCVAALAADGGFLERPRFALVLGKLPVSIWPGEVLDLVVLASVGPLAAHVDLSNVSRAVADFDFADLLVVHATFDSTFSVALIPRHGVAGVAGADWDRKLLERGAGSLLGLKLLLKIQQRER